MLGGFRAAIVGVLEDEIMQDNLINGTCIASVLPDEAAKGEMYFEVKHCL